MSTLQQIKSMPIAGNAHMDAPIFRAVDAFVRDSANKTGDKAELILWMGTQVMGLLPEDAGAELPAQELVATYLA